MTLIRIWIKAIHKTKAGIKNKQPRLYRGCFYS